MKNQTKPNSRRKFLLAASLGGAGAAAAVVVGKKVGDEAAPAAQALGERRGYHVSEHILKYYKTTQV
jgi:hypothetical protein